jgi:cytochrome c553
VVNSEGFEFAINFLREGNWVIMKTIRIMTLTVTVAALFTAVVMVSAASLTEGGEQFDAGATYKSKCVACHG